MTPRPRFIGSEIYRRSSYGSPHPLVIPRVSTVIDLCRVLGWLPDGAYIDSPRASPAQLRRFHDADYVAAMIDAECTGRIPPEAQRRYNIGVNGNPVFPEIFSRPATACGGSIRAAELLHEGGIVYSPAGGTHHGRPDRASGFCYFNDPVLGILAMLDGGLRRVAYVDLDAHHGDGVESAFADRSEVLTISVHESGRWPGSGVGPGCNWRTARNVPVPPDLNDDEMAAVVDGAILPAVASFHPQALVVQCGADALADDPLSRLALSNGALWWAVRDLVPLAPRLLVLGGGGYNPWSVARCWTGIWAVLNGFEIPGRLPAAAESILRSLHWRRSRGRNPPEAWFTTLADPPHRGPVRAEVRRAIAAAREPSLSVRDGV